MKLGRGLGQASLSGTRVGCRWNLLDLVQTAVDKQLHPRDVAAFIAGQEENCIRNFLRPSDATEWNGSRHLIGELAHLLGRHAKAGVVAFRWNHAWADDVHANTATFQVRGPASGE